jgi:hypothetical protein
MDARVPLTDRIIELRYLTELANGLKSGISPLACGKNAPKEQPELIDRLKQLIAGAKNKLDSQPIFPFDFTDRLWDVLKTVKSMEILRQCIQLVYDQMQTGEFHVLVEANKVSSLAKMLRVRNPADNIFPRLEPLVCLQMLIEIGLDRFNGELAYHFFSRHFLPNSFDLEPYFLPQAKPLESKIERLFPLHLALQSAVAFNYYNICISVNYHFPSDNYGRICQISGTRKDKCDKVSHRRVLQMFSQLTEYLVFGHWRERRI